MLALVRMYLKAEMALLALPMMVVVVVELEP